MNSQKFCTQQYEAIPPLKSLPNFRQNTISIPQLALSIRYKKIARDLCREYEAKSGQQVASPPFRAVW